MCPLLLRALFASAGLLGLCGVAAAADPWIQPGDERLRHDIALLADAGLLAGPQTLWPASWPDIARDLTAEPATGSLSIAEQQARERLLRAARRAAQPGFGGLGLAVAGASDPVPLRGFAETPREEAEIGGGVRWLGDRFAAALEVSAVSQPSDGQDVRLDGSYVGVTIGNFMFAAGAQPRWWGPGWDGSLILGTNARPIPAVAAERKYAERSRWPVLRAFGPWRASFFLGRAEGSDVAVPDTRVFGARIAFKPRPWLELGLSRTAQWCGEGRPCDFTTFRDLLIGRDNRDDDLTVDEEPGNQLAGYDLRLRSPWRKLPLVVYGQFIGEDEANGLPSKFLGLYGLEFWGGVRSGASWRLRLEQADTACAFSRERPLFECAYRNGLYAQGYSYRDRIIGHPLDNDGRMTTIGAIWVAPSGTAWSLTARRAELNRDGKPDPDHRLSPLGAAILRTAELRVDSAWRGTAFTLGVAYDDDSKGAVGESALRGFLRLGRSL